jgi:hypothetical protein
MIVYDTWRGFDWVKKSRKKLVVTIGESWTWGDSLGKTQHRVYDDKECRLAHVYGGQLADMYNADFLNIAKPGESNLWIAKHFNFFVDNHDELPYDDIIVVLTMTELGREFNGDLDCDRDYVTDLKDTLTLTDFFTKLSSYVADEILAANTNKIKLLIGTNFVESNYPDRLQVLEKSWVDIIAEELQISVDKPCYVVGSWVFERFHQMLEFTPKYNREVFLQDMSQHMDVAKIRTNFLLDSKFNYKKASKHPTPEGHTFWAKYLYNSLNIN